jgi:hypothetical protein
MSSFASSLFLRHSRRSPITACITALVTVSASSAWAAPPAVTTCLDDGSAGTLRYAVDPTHGAVSGDTIDMSALACGTITLSTGAIAVGQQKLTIKGPGADLLTIDGQNAGRVIVHSYAGSTGHLYVQDVKLEHGAFSTTAAARGGCIASLSGSLTLTQVVVDHCSVTITAASASNHAYGGGVFTAGSLTIVRSRLQHSGAYGVSNFARGGCAASMGAFDMRDSTVLYCNAESPGNLLVRGGALELGGNVVITGSVIGMGYSSNDRGGIDIFNKASPGTLTTTISNSTITKNVSHGYYGGLYANSGHVNIDNSTIVLNEAGGLTGGGPRYYSPGVELSSFYAPVTLSLQSTIIANNSANGVQNDLGVGASSNVTITGSNNLVRNYGTGVTVPGNLPKGTCPNLGPLRDNGGPTYTHALQSGSLAIDAGNNSADDPHTGVPAVYDQRGQGPVSPLYTRESGTADIGAYEMQKTDAVFNTEFETNCL